MSQLIDEWKVIVDKNFVFLIIFGPLLVALLFGYAYQNSQINDAPLAIVDLDNSTTSIALINKLSATQAIDVKDVFHNSIDPNTLMYNENYVAVLYLPKGLEASRLSGAPVNIGFYIDTMLQGASGSLRTAVSEVLATENMQFGIGSMTALGLSESQASAMLSNYNVQQRLLYNPTNHMLNGPAFGIMNSIMLSILLSATASIIPRLREDGKLEQVLRRPTGIFMRALPYALITCVSLYLGIGLMKALGGMRFEANIFTLFLPFIVYSMTVALLAILIGWTAKTPGGAGKRALIIIIPSVLAGGGLRPSLTLPSPLQTLGEFLPISWHFKLLRGLGMRGGELQFFATEIGRLLLLICGILCLMTLLLLRERSKMRRAKKEELSNTTVLTDPLT